MLEKKTAIDQIIILNVEGIPTLQCRHSTWVEEDGVMVGTKASEKHVYSPIDTIDITHEKVQAIASVVFTQDVIDAYNALYAPAVEEAPTEQPPVEDVPVE